MFIKINSGDDLMRELNCHLNENVVIHYVCKYCGDEQVTYKTEIDSDFLDYFIRYKEIRIGLSCTECGNVTWDVSHYDIFGIETIND